MSFGRTSYASPTLNLLEAPKKKSGTRIARPSESKRKSSWPKTLAERAHAVDVALRAAKSPVTPEELAQQFSRAKPKDIREVLETLCVLGKAKHGKKKGTYRI